MRAFLRTMGVAGVLAFVSVLGVGASRAKAQAIVYTYGGYPGGGYYGGGYPGGYYGVPSYSYGGYPVGGYYGANYGVPSYSYYGNGGHDFQPHWHTRQTPFGAFSYYGLGAHDFRPHAHVQTPYGITGYSNGFFSNTQSYSPPSPYTYMPW